MSNGGGCWGLLRLHTRGLTEPGPALKETTGDLGRNGNQRKKIRARHTGEAKIFPYLQQATEQAAANCSNSLETTQRKKG